MTDQPDETHTSDHQQVEPEPNNELAKEDDDDENSTHSIADDDEEHLPADNNNHAANKLRFAELCKRMEYCFCSKRKKQRVTKEQLAECILPRPIRNRIKGKDGTGSPYQILRLVFPDCDGVRPHLGMKEDSVSKRWAETLGLNPNSSAYKKIRFFNNPDHAGLSAQGDLSQAIREVISDRHGDDESSVTVGQINDWLDELAAIKQLKGSLRTDKQISWINRLLQYGLGPLEHRWIIRIILNKCDLGIGFETFASFLHERAVNIYNSHRSLRYLCSAISDPVWLSNYSERCRIRDKILLQHKRMNYMPRVDEDISIETTLSPQLSSRTSFSNIMSEIGKHHKDFAKMLSEGIPGKESLAIKFPSFLIETKLDGERMIVHIKRGVVKLHSRRDNWFTSIYSPVIGPPLRKSLLPYDIDVVLDGELISWDFEKNRAIPFGLNKTIAKARRDYLIASGQSGNLDLNHHGPDDEKGLSSYDIDTFSNGAVDLGLIGAKCGLKYIVFDVLFVGGPDASKVMKCLSKFSINNDSDQCYKTGSIIDLDLFQRRKLLHNIIENQKNEVEIVESFVVRSDGTAKCADAYFQDDDSIIDSVSCALDEILPTLGEIDIIRRNNKGDDEIEIDRALQVEHIYAQIVEQNCEEGLIFKDLNAPYVLGSRSRSTGYWKKLKPDYENNADASDLDFVVIGGYFATGLERAGVLAQFLLACVHKGNDGSINYFSVGKVAGGGTSRDNLEKLLDHTGYKRPTESNPSVDYGKWFSCDDKQVPSFVSLTSYQRNLDIGDDEGWSPISSKVYPDKWIAPEDSFVLTVNASEIVMSSEYSAGVSLRFPRISSIRLDKPCEDVETLLSLHQTYASKRRCQSASYESNILKKSVVSSRFLTPSQKQKSKRKGLKKNSNEFVVPAVDTISYALKGLTFSVLEGAYNGNPISKYIDNSGLEYMTKLQTFECRDDVIAFIRRHSGAFVVSGNKETSFIIGDKLSDSRVKAYSKATENSCSVVHWSFVVNMVFRWLDITKKLKLEDGRIDNRTIVEGFEYLLQPQRYDYLVTSSHDKKLLEHKEIFETLDYRAVKSLLHNVQQKRARNGCEEVSQTPKLEVNYISFLDESEYWVLGGKRRKLWPFHSTCDSKGDITCSYHAPKLPTMTLVYVDLDNLSNVDSAALESVVPLIEAMGGTTTKNVNINVTHILTSLLCSHREIALTEVLSRRVSSDFTQSLQQRGCNWYNQLAQSRDRDQIKLISPEWVRNMFS